MPNGTIFTAKDEEEQASIVALLEEALREAKLGNFHAIGIVACLSTGYATVMAGRNAADLNLGCDSLKRKILDAIESGNRRGKPTVLHAVPR